jgi:hypothetical protein
LFPKNLRDATEAFGFLREVFEYRINIDRERVLVLVASTPADY